MIPKAFATSTKFYPATTSEFSKAAALKVIYLGVSTLNFLDIDCFID